MQQPTNWCDVTHKQKNTRFELRGKRRTNKNKSLEKKRNENTIIILIEPKIFGLDQCFNGIDKNHLLTFKFGIFRQKNFFGDIVIFRWHNI